MRRPAGIIAAAVLLGLGVAPGAHAACRGAGTALTDLNGAVVRPALECLVNEERTKRGLPKLRPHALLEQSAQAHAEDMRNRGFVDHVNPDGLDPFERLRAIGYPFVKAGENLRWGDQSPRQAVAGWMRSKGHCANILDPGFAEIGSGAATGVTSSDLPGRVLPAYVLVLARRQGRREPSTDRRPERGCPGSKRTIKRRRR